MVCSAAERKEETGLTTILYAGAVLGVLGIVFGLVLNFAGKKFHVEVDERIEKVRACLGGANCGACGYPGCDGFAEAVVRGDAKPNGCAPAGEKGAAEIARIMGVEAQSTERLVARVLCQGRDGIAISRYNYDGYRSCIVAAGIAGGPKSCRFACIGLGDCMDHCAFGAISMVGGLAHIDEKKCAGCGACAENCPRGAIRMLPVSQSVVVRCRNRDTAREARAVCMNACIGCGRCKRECTYDAITIQDGCAHIDPAKCTRCGACEKVCPCRCITNASAQPEGQAAI